jgi:putative chitinase
LFLIYKNKNILIMNFDVLKGQVPDSVLEQLPMVRDKFGINTPTRLAHFLAQCSHESGNFKAVVENLNYSADGLRKIFGKYFPSVELANQYARNQEMIGSRVYGGRMGNGAEPTKEGFKFRGRGFIQLTGKSNYDAFGKVIGEDLAKNPDLVSTKYSLISAAWFFDRNKLQAICDKGLTDAVITELTKKINGGTIGLSHRISETKKFAKLLGL